MAQKTKNNKVKFSVYASVDVKNFLDDLAVKEERSLAFITARALQFYKDAMQGNVTQTEQTTIQVKTRDNDVEECTVKNKIEDNINKIEKTVSSSEQSWVD